MIESPQSASDPNEEQNFDHIPLDQVSLPKLRQLMGDAFSLEEINTFIFDLHLDPENIAGQDKITRIRELIGYFQRRSRLRVLLVALHEARPLITPASVRRDPQEVAETTEPPLDLSEQDRSDTRTAERTLQALREHMSIPSVREATITFRADFKAVSQQLARLYNHKKIHDLFQSLENHYSLLDKDYHLLSEDELWESTFFSEPELRGTIDDLLEAVSEGTLMIDQLGWVSQLNIVKDEMRQAVEETNRTQLYKSLRLLHRILNRQPTRINAELVTTARSLRLLALRSALSTISETLGIIDPREDAVQQTNQGAMALANLDNRVVVLANEHDAWQEIDDELRQVEVSLNQAIHDIADAWSYPKRLARELIVNKQEPWAIELITYTQELDRALGEKVVVNFKRQFRRFRSLVNRRFRQVDRDLLGLGRELQQVGESLDLLLRNL